MNFLIHHNEACPLYLNWVELGWFHTYTEKVEYTPNENQKSGIWLIFELMINAHADAVYLIVRTHMPKGKITNSSASIQNPISSANWNILIIMLHCSHVSQKNVFCKQFDKYIEFQTSVVVVWVNVFMKFHCLSLASSSPLRSGSDIQYISVTPFLITWNVWWLAIAFWHFPHAKKKFNKNEMKKNCFV